jgi:hypothetical protein
VAYRGIILELKKTAITFDESDILELEKIIIDSDEKKAFQFLKKSIYDKVLHAQQSR